MRFLATAESACLPTFSVKSTPPHLLDLTVDVSAIGTTYFHVQMLIGQSPTMVMQLTMVGTLMPFAVAGEFCLLAAVTFCLSTPISPLRHPDLSLTCGDATDCIAAGRVIEWQ